MPDAVREAKPGEGARLAEVYLSSGRAAWARHLSPVGLSGVTSPAEEWERLISDPDPIILVAERRGQVAALAVLCRSTDQDSDPVRVALLDRLYTEPASWRRGLGRGAARRGDGGIARAGVP